jgi:hypothetical protein
MIMIIEHDLLLDHQMLQQVRIDIVAHFPA